MCPQNVVSRGWVENMWSSTATPLHVSIDLFITWLSWERVGLYLQFPTWVHWTYYHVAGFRIGGALPPLPYMFPQNFLSRGCVQNGWTTTSTPTCVHWTYHVAGLRMGGALTPLPYMCPQNVYHVVVLGKWMSTSTPLHVSTEILTLLGWERVELYLQSAKCVVRNFYHVCVEKMWSSISTPLHVPTELITGLGWELAELYLQSPTRVHRNFYHMVVWRNCGSLPSLPYMCLLNLSCSRVEKW